MPRRAQFIYASPEKQRAAAAAAAAGRTPRRGGAAERSYFVYTVIAMIAVVCNPLFGVVALVLAGQSDRTLAP